MSTLDDSKMGSLKDKLRAKEVEEKKVVKDKPEDKPEVVKINKNNNK